VDEVVRVEILDAADPFLKSLLGPNDDPQWWLEGSSYPIRILNEKKVHVLDKSTLGDVESAFTSSAMMSKIIFDKKEQMKKKANPRKENDSQKI